MTTEQLIEKLLSFGVFEEPKTIVGKYYTYFEVSDNDVKITHNNAVPILIYLAKLNAKLSKGYCSTKTSTDIIGYKIKNILVRKLWDFFKPLNMAKYYKGVVYFIDINNKQISFHIKDKSYYEEFEDFFEWDGITHSFLTDTTILNKIDDLIKKCISHISYFEVDYSILKWYRDTGNLSPIKIMEHLNKYLSEKTKEIIIKEYISSLSDECLIIDLKIYANNQSFGKNKIKKGLRIKAENTLASAITFNFLWEHFEFAIKYNKCVSKSETLNKEINLLISEEMDYVNKNYNFYCKMHNKYMNTINSLKNRKKQILNNLIDNNDIENIFIIQ